jgi:hypothetical protein
MPVLLLVCVLRWRIAEGLGNEYFGGQRRVDRAITIYQVSWVIWPNIASRPRAFSERAAAF